MLCGEWVPVRGVLAQARKVLFVEASEGLSCGHNRRPSCKSEMPTGQNHRYSMVCVCVFGDVV